VNAPQGTFITEGDYLHPPTAWRQGFSLQKMLEPYPWRKVDTRRRKKRLAKKLEKRRLAYLDRMLGIEKALIKRLQKKMEDKMVGVVLSLQYAHAFGHWIDKSVKPAWLHRGDLTTQEKGLATA
jgi:hypothetical protein